MISPEPSEPVRLLRTRGERSGSLWFPQTQGRAGRVDDDAEPARTDHFRHILYDGGAQRFGLLGYRGDIVDLDVGQPGGRAAGGRVLHHSAARSLPDLDHGVAPAASHRDVLRLPIKHFSVKV